MPSLSFDYATKAIHISIQKNECETENNDKELSLLWFLERAAVLGFISMPCGN